VRRVRLGSEPTAPLFQGTPYLACHQCSQCSGVCPSFRQGGINPRDTVMRYVSGMGDPRDPTLWLCTMCQSCTERCQMEVGPADLIQDLRSSAVQTGNCPKAFSDEARLFLRTGMSFPNSGLTKKIRKEMGLPDIQTDARTLEELTIISKRSRLGELKLD
jgi:heterodisulfide reductase subunit C